jgi:hypothetical protein
MGDDEDTEFHSDARYAWLQGRVEAAFCNVQGAKFEKAFEVVETQAIERSVSLSCLICFHEWLGTWHVARETRAASKSVRANDN